VDDATLTPSPAVPRPVEPQAVFRALTDATRRKILQLLLEEEVSVSELVEILQQPQSTVSRHLKVLRSAGLVHDRREGTTSLYRATEPGGRADCLEPMLLAWLRRQPLADMYRERLRRVLQKRSDEAVDFFERLGKRWDELRTAAFGDCFGYESLVHLLPGTWTVADIGTGTGQLLPALAEHFQRVIAVEPAPAMIECARQRIAETGATNVVFHQGDLGHLPIRSGACDLAIAVLVIHHVAEPRDALAEMHRVVRPGGSILIVEQHAHENQSFYETMQDLWWGFEPGALVQQVAAAGFEDVAHRALWTPRHRVSGLDGPDLFSITARRSAEKT